MNTVRAIDFEEKKYSKLVDDIYFYLYNNYRTLALEEGTEPVDLNTFIDALLNDIDNFKAEQNKHIKYKL